MVTENNRQSLSAAFALAVYSFYWVAMETALSEVARPFYFRSHDQQCLFYNKIILTTLFYYPQNGKLDVLQTEGLALIQLF